MDKFLSYMSVKLVKLRSLILFAYFKVMSFLCNIKYGPLIIVGVEIIATIYVHLAMYSGGAQRVEDSIVHREHNKRLINR